MTLMKIALTVLGTVGLTAGTVLAVAEHTPSSLPEAAAKAGACSGCPTKTCGTASCTSAVAACTKGDAFCSKDRECPNQSVSAAGPLADGLGAAVQHAAAFLDDVAGSAAPSGISDLNRCEFVTVAAQNPSCESGKCTSAVSACAKPVSACAKSCDEKNTCQSDSANTIGGPLDPGVIEHVAATCCEVKAACAASECSSTKSVCSSAACETEKVCENESGCATAKKTKKLTLSLGFGSNGPIIRLASGETPAPCPEEVCDGLAACLKNAVAACPCQAGACEENCDACPCEGQCGQTEQVAATACEAKSACAGAVCPTAACDASVCQGSACDTAACAAGTCDASNCSSCPEGCRASETAADEDFSDSAVAACDCKDCCCEACECTTDTACPPGEICPVAVRLRGFQTAGILPNGIQLMATRIAAAGEPCDGQVRCSGNACVAGEAVEQPGRVRMTHLPGLPILPPGAQFQPNGFVSFWPQSLGAAFPTMACGAEVESPKNWAALRTASHAEPTGHTASRHPVMGTWGRSLGPSTISFVIDGDRIRGTCDESIQFAGTCSVSQDGQVFGVIDEVRYSDEPSAALLTQSLIDQPFAFRFTIDGEDLIVKDFRCGGMNVQVKVDGVTTQLAAHVAAFACGRYERGPSE